jgi:zinc protease
MTSFGLRAFAMASLLLAAPALADKPIPAGEKIAPDPAVRFGTMVNGLRYAIMSNHSPSGAISIRLVMRVGSIDEADDELGYAHFIEHMAFRSTRQAPGGTLDNPFAAYGIALGRDQNAGTALETTLFNVDLPASGARGAGPILEWMRNAVDSILFTPAAVDAERGVVIAELQSRNGPIADLQRQVLHFQAGGLRFGNRDPGGTEESLKAATPQRLHAFYDRWYRPENAVLVIVGDAPADDLQHMAEQAFSTWKSRGEPGMRPPPPARLGARGIDAMTISGPALPSALGACRLEAKAGDTPVLEQRRREAYSQLWTQIIDNRFKHAVAETNSPLIAALALVSEALSDLDASCLVAVPTGDKWREALQLSQSELRRFGKDGPTQQELDEALEQLRAPLRGAATIAGTRKSAATAQEIVAALIKGRPFSAPDESLRVFELAVAGVTPADVRNAFARDWAGSGPLLTAAGPAAPSREDLLAAWRANETAAPLSAYADRKSATWLYSDFGPAGTVDRREALPEYVRLHFRNGTWLNFKQTRIQSKQVVMRVRFGPGESGLSAGQRWPAALGSGMIAEGGLGRMDYEQVESAMASTTWHFSLDAQPSAFVLSANPLTDQVESELQLLAAYMTDPGFRHNMDEKLPTSLDFIYRLYRTEPALVAGDALEHRLFGENASIPARDKMASWHAADFAGLLKPYLTAAPVEVTIVGDIGEAEAQAAVAGTFGAIPARPPMPKPAGDGPFRRFPDTLPPPFTVYHDGPKDKAAAILMWPLYVASAERRKEEYALALVNAVFKARLFQKVRVQMGKVYDPEVTRSMPDHADQGYLSATLQATPGDLDDLVAATRSIADDLARGSITQAEIDRERHLLVAARLAARQRNEPWAEVISGTRDEAVAMDELLAYPDQMAALTLDDVRKAASTWLKGAPAIVRALPRPAGSAAAP